MENLSRNMEKDIARLKITSNPRHGMGWQVLLIGGNGKIVSFKSLRLLVWIFLGFFSLAVGSAIVSFILFNSMRSGNISAKKEIAAAREKIKTLEGRNDILMASLVKTEQKLKKTALVKTTKKEKAIKPKSRTKEKNIAIDRKIIKSMNKVPDGKIDANDLKLVFDPLKGILRISFMIKNVDNAVGNLSGYIFVILKQDKGGKESIFPIPSVKLVSGRPVDVGRGQFFKISRFKEVKFRVDHQKQVDKYNRAVIYIYGKNRQLMLEKDFNLNAIK